MRNLGLAVIDREAHGANRRSLFPGDLDLHAHVLDVRVLKQLGHVVHRRMGHVLGCEPFQPIGARLLLHDRAQSPLQLLVVAPPVGPGLEARVVDELRTARRLA